MRVQVPGIRRSGTDFRFRFENRSITAYPGESVASALLAAGVYGFRETRSGKRRGVFCGMGVCGDCQVMIDGLSRRACMEPARAGLSVARHPAYLTPTAEPIGQVASEWIEKTPDLLVVGAGPAGLSAARTAAAAGLDVLVVDERHHAGGQYFKQPSAGFEVDEDAIDSQFAAGRRLIREAEAAGAHFCFNVIIWGVFDGNRIAAISDVGNLLIAAKRIILGPGAYERALPVPGWTLPGVMTTGAAQTLLRAYQTAPGQRVLIAGNGPLNLQVADELSRAGVKVAGVAELAASPWRSAPLAAFTMVLNSPLLMLAGVRHLWHLARRKVPIMYRHVLVSVEGEDKVTHATIAAVDDVGNILAGSNRRFAVDAVCVNYGFLPQSELARALDCAFDYDHRSGQLRAVRDKNGRSSVPTVFIVGDAGGLGGAKVAADQGELAGLAVVRDLRPSHKTSRDGAAHIRRRLRRDEQFQKALWQIFKAPFLATQLAQGDTQICRCEEIERRTLDQLMTRKRPGLGAIKKATRAGMGRCQGRYCTTLIEALSVQHGAAPTHTDDFFAPRPPAKPLAIGRIAKPCGTPLQLIDVNSKSENR